MSISYSNFLSGSKDLKREGKRSKRKSNFKAIVIVFCDIRGIVHIDWVPGVQTVNQVYYKEVLTILCEGVRRKRPEMWKDSWILHHNNTPAHNALSVRTFLAKHKVPVLEH
jgi:hypothetical protein